MRTELWASDATRSEMQAIETLSIQIEVVEGKAAPHLKRLKELKQMRWRIVNKARSRSAYRRGLVAKSRQRRRV
jgi:hypothetical protein